MAKAATLTPVRSKVRRAVRETETVALPGDSLGRDEALRAAFRASDLSPEDLLLRCGFNVMAWLLAVARMHGAIVQTALQQQG
jgi:hypothetical protein